MDKLTLIENSLIPVYRSDKGSHLVNARELHEFLESSQEFTNWIKNRIEKYDFVENEDFLIILSKTDGRPRTDYIFKLEPAKEIAMVENNEKGKLIRRYFIKIEERFKQQVIDYSKLSPELQMIQALLVSSARLETQVKELSETTQAIKDTIITQLDNWREDIHRMFNDIVRAVSSKEEGNKYEELRHYTYEELEKRAHVNLKSRLMYYKARLLTNGATRAEVDKANRMDIVEQDPKLREIYTAIIKELTIKHCA